MRKSAFNLCLMGLMIALISGCVSTKTTTTPPVESPALTEDVAEIDPAPEEPIISPEEDASDIISDSGETQADGDIVVPIIEDVYRETQRELPAGFNAQEHLDKILSSVITDDMSDEDIIWAFFKWMKDNLSYRGITVDYDRGYTPDHIEYLSDYMLATYKGSCEHYASLLARFFEQMGYEYEIIRGNRLIQKSNTWGDHSWVIAKIDGTYYHFDPLYERNHSGIDYSYFKKEDKDLAETHQWNKDDYPPVGENLED